MSKIDRAKEQERGLRVLARKTHEPMTIENCRFEFKCPKQWSELQDDGKLDSRFCDVCEQRVYLCVTDDELRTRAAAGECVVIFRVRAASSKTTSRPKRESARRIKGLTGRPAWPRDGGDKF